MRTCSTEIKRKGVLTLGQSVKKGFVEELSLAWVDLEELEIQEEEQDQQPKVRGT